MKNIIKIAALAFLVSYILFSFVLLELNFVKWTQLNRHAFVILSIFLSTIFSVINELNKLSS